MAKLKAGVFLSVFVFACCVFLLAVFPKKVVTNKEIYSVLSPFVDRQDKNLVLYDYIYYDGEKDFKKYAKTDVEKEFDKALSDFEFLVVRVNDEADIAFGDKVVVIFDKMAEKEKCEFYLAKNVNFFRNSVPLKSVYNVAYKIAVKINGFTVKAVDFFLLLIMARETAVCCSIIKKIQNFDSEKGFV